MSLTDKKCLPCEGNAQPLAVPAAKKMLEQLKNWQLAEDYQSISRHFMFKNFLRTMSFVNAVAWVANQENHHPELQVGYQYCTITFTTHAINGLSENDFICAAKIDQLLGDENSG